MNEIEQQIKELLTNDKDRMEILSSIFDKEIEEIKIAEYNRGYSDGVNTKESLLY